jgi:hypothetical protein
LNNRDVLSLHPEAAQLNTKDLNELGLSHLQSVNLFYENR